MGKTRDLFKKIKDTKGTFHAKIGTIKDRNGMDLTEAEDIKKRWKEYTEALYKKDLHFKLFFYILYNSSMVLFTMNIFSIYNKIKVFLSIYINIYNQKFKILENNLTKIVNILWRNLKIC